MLRSIQEEPNVTHTLQQACGTYPRVWDAFDAMCWILAHRQLSGATFQGLRELYYLHKQAAGGWAVPALTTIYTVSPELIRIHTLKVG